MAKITFNSENKVKNDSDFPKLYLDHGERARIVVIETDPEVNFVHTLRAPAIVNGVVQMETVKGKGGEITEKVKYDFVGRHLCFGNMNTLMEKGKDPENCVTCAAHQQNEAIGEAVRRFAMHVVQYKVQPGTYKIQQPFSADLRVWAFTNKTFDAITDIAEEHGDLRAKDLLLGPCENKMFQNFDINVGGSAEWLASEENKKFVQALYAQNKMDDLNPAIGRKVTREQAQDDINKVLMRHAQAFGSADKQADVLGSMGGAADLDTLLSGGGAAPETPAAEPATPAAVATEAAPAATPPIEDFSLDVSASASAEPTTSAPAAEEPKKTMDFDSLLAGLDV